MRIRDLKLGSIMLVVALWGLSTHSARADSILTQIDMSDTDGGGWTTSANAFEFHLFATSGTNPAAGFLNSGTDVALPAVGLTVGDNVFTLVGNDNSGLESQGTPVITLHFSDGSTLTDTASNVNSATLTGGTIVTLTQFAYIPYQNSGINLVGNHVDAPDGFADTVAHVTINVSPEPGSQSVMLLGVCALCLLGAVRRRLRT